MGIDAISYSQYSPYTGQSQAFGTMVSGANRQAYQGMPSTFERVEGAFKVATTENMERILQAQQNGELSVNPFEVNTTQAYKEIKNIYNGTGELAPSIANREDIVEDSDFAFKYPEGLVA